jgi:hypothetical protein
MDWRNELYNSDLARINPSAARRMVARVPLEPADPLGGGDDPSPKPQPKE